MRHKIFRRVTQTRQKLVHQIQLGGSEFAHGLDVQLALERLTAVPPAWAVSLTDKGTRHPAPAFSRHIRWNEASCRYDSQFVHHGCTLKRPGQILVVVERSGASQHDEPIRVNSRSLIHQLHCCLETVEYDNIMPQDV